MRIDAGRGTEIRCEYGYTQWQWADHLLGHTSGRTAAAMNAHRADCSACEAHYAAWRELLADLPADRSARLSGEAGERAEGLSVIPSERHRKSLARAVRAAGRRHRRRRTPRLWAAAGLAAAVLLVFMLLRTIEPADPVGDYIVLREPNATAVLEAPDTTRFKIIPAYGLPGEGFVWLSGDAAEALLYLDGLPELEAADYQAWAIRGSHSDSLGLLKLANGKAHLHIRSRLLRGAETISLSAEPKGGSLRPTTEPMALVLFEAGR